MYTYNWPNLFGPLKLLVLLIQQILDAIEDASRTLIF